MAQHINKGNTGVLSHRVEQSRVVVLYSSYIRRFRRT